MFLFSVHSFGPYNFHQEHNKFRALLNGIHSRCKQCKSWSNSKHAVKAFVVSTTLFHPGINLLDCAKGGLFIL